jgi:radical SAM superfamily enzyme YgiQ (UPF0313 family)
MSINKVVLIEPKSPGVHVFSGFKLPRLGLPILGALLKEMGISSTIYYQQATRLDWNEIGSADLVGISTTTSTAPEAYRLAQRVKSLGDIPVVLGGAHSTFMPDEGLRSGADYVVRGEGEETLPELIGYLNGKGSLDDIRGLSYLRDDEVVHAPDRPRVKHLSSLPWPDLKLIRGFEKMRVVPMVTSRGCPFDCNFCSVTQMFGRQFRFRETEDVIAEMAELYHANPKRTFFFYDDNFTANRARTVELLNRMLEEGITPHWTAQARVDIAHDPELLDLMRRSGCKILYLGLESINPNTLEEFNKQQTVEDIEEAVTQLHKRHIMVHGMFVLGSDADNPGTVRDTVRFAKKTGVDSVQFMILTPLPGTQLFEQLQAEERIFDYDWERYSGFHPVFYPRNMSPARLQFEIILNAYRKFYSSWQCWKMGLSFRWRDMAIRLYGHRVVTRWRQYNHDLLADVKRLCREEKRRVRKSVETPQYPASRTR